MEQEKREGPHLLVAEGWFVDGHNRAPKGRGGANGRVRARGSFTKTAETHNSRNQNTTEMAQRTAGRALFWLSISVNKTPFGDILYIYIFALPIVILSAATLIDRTSCEESIVRLPQTLNR